MMHTVPGYVLIQYLTGHGTYNEKFNNLGIRSICKCGEVASLEHAVFVSTLFEGCVEFRTDLQVKTVSEICVIRFCFHFQCFGLL